MQSWALHTVFSPPVFGTTAHTTVGSSKAFTYATADDTDRSWLFGVYSPARVFQGLLKSHAFLCPVIDTTDTNSILSTPLSNSFSNSVDRLVPIPTRVVSLRYPVSPPAVKRCIVSIGVDSIKFMLRGWLGAHIFHKLLESVTRPEPSIGHLYTSATIPVVAPVVRIANSHIHRPPRVVLGLIDAGRVFEILEHIKHYNVSIRNCQ